MSSLSSLTFGRNFVWICVFLLCLNKIQCFDSEDKTFLTNPEWWRIDKNWDDHAHNMKGKVYLRRLPLTSDNRWHSCYEYKVWQSHLDKVTKSRIYSAILLSLLLDLKDAHHQHCINYFIHIRERLKVQGRRDHNPEKKIAHLMKFMTHCFCTLIPFRKQCQKVKLSLTGA